MTQLFMDGTLAPTIAELQAAGVTSLRGIAKASVWSGVARQFFRIYCFWRI